MSRDYQDFIANKRQLAGDFGFEPTFLPDWMFDFQKSLVEWAMRKGRAAIFADCGLGKTPMQLVWAENVVRKTNRPVLILTPLAVSYQTVGEAEKFGIEAKRSGDGKANSKIVVTNYERLGHFSPDDFAGVVCDESSILKNYAGSTRDAITRFMRKTPYRLLCTATAAPNDYIELGTSCEALGVMRRVEMLAMFFTHDGGETSKWRVKKHAEDKFWTWVCSWARAVRKPSDIGFSDDRFSLPPLIVNDHFIQSRTTQPGMLFDLPVMTLNDERAERKRTMPERVDMVASLVNAHNNPCVCWCHLNAEGDAIAKAIPDAVQVSGADDDNRKENVFHDFACGNIRVLVTKPSIAGFGLNWQHCAHQTFFPSHSFEQWYQAIRRCWRFGQKSPVTVDIIACNGEARALENMKSKADASDVMFAKITSLMNEHAYEKESHTTKASTETPSWL